MNGIHSITFMHSIEASLACPKNLADAEMHAIAPRKLGAGAPNEKRALL